MNMPIFLLLIFMTLGTDAGAAIQSEGGEVLQNQKQYFVIEVDRSRMTKDSVLRLKLDVQFDESNAAHPLDLISKDLIPNLEEPEQESSGYLITIKLPIVETWREKGKSLKIKLTADTEIPNQPAIGLNDDSE